MVNRSENCEDDNVVTSQTEDARENRRKLFRKLVVLAGLGVTGVLLSQDKSGLLPRAEATSGGTSGTALIIDGSPANTGTGTTELDSTTSFTAFKVTSSGDGVEGVGGGSGTGVVGRGGSTDGTGVFAVGGSTHGSGLVALGGPTGISVAANSGGTGAIPIVAAAVSGQTASLQEWRNSSGTALASVNKSGLMLAPQLGQNSPNTVLVTPANPSGFTNVNPTFKMDGLAVAFTPKLTGNVIVSVNLDQYNTAFPANVYAQLWYGTGAAPSFGASPPGGAVQFGPTLSFSTGTGFHNNIGILLLEI